MSEPFVEGIFLWSQPPKKKPASTESRKGFVLTGEVSKQELTCELEIALCLLELYLLKFANAHLPSYGLSVLP